MLKGATEMVNGVDGKRYSEGELIVDVTEVTS